MKKLPNKPSELLLVALADLEKIEQNPKYTISMDRWYYERAFTTCEVCLAGSVMVSRLDPVESMNLVGRADPLDYEVSIQRKLYAINHLRLGHIDDAFNLLNLQLPRTLPLSIHPDHRDYNLGDLDYMSEYDRSEWKLHMLDLVGILQAEGF